MGCFYGVQLQEAGCDVLLLDIFQEHIDKLNGEGLKLTKPDGSVSIHAVKAAHSGEGKFRLADLVIVFVDTNALDSVIPQIASLLKSDGFVLTLQNGVGNLEKLISNMTPDQIIAGTSMNSCEFIGPGHVRHVIHGLTTIGEAGGEIISARVGNLCDLMGLVDDKIEAVADIRPYIWSKLIINCAVNPLCALTGLLPGQLQETAEVKNLQAQITNEIVDLCRAMDIHLPEFDLPNSGPIEEVWRKSKGGANKPSMVQHLEAGRKTEIDALNGAVVGMARETGISTPINETITSLIKGLEASTIK
jgi:2-dehydropantoate 2-reductase